ncbi:PHB depolymerase family esterase [Telluria mixta]|uniref:PHB depolymerase family esterase n=1 Tax=Telluria mixta TaxID=34071 RepID=A0ABT2BZH6_9BURK|nr:PHB depolymerase family esterase [Telluria mixta]MCS0630539.1 PHB depolymerase family esterase [Telluria mixta]WEM94158.1 PHB depolymerase family esterase [Telluria mixta]
MLSTMLDAWSNLTQPPWVGMPAVSGARNVVAGHFDDEAGSLQYKLFVPAGYRGDALPLIVMLHGGNQDADDFALGTGMNTLAEEYGCVVLYPEQSSRANWSMCWNWFEERHHHRGQGEPGLIAALTRKVIDDHAIDASRVYVAGLSAGGAMAVILGRTYPELFAAVGCHSGLAHGSATDSYSAIQAMHGGIDANASAHASPTNNGPIIVFHGDADFTVHPSNSTSVVQQFLDSYVARTPDADVSVSSEAGRARGRAYERKVHRDADGRIVVEHWTIKGGRHAWSGGTGRGSHSDESGPDASLEMLRFFLGVPEFSECALRRR